MNYATGQCAPQVDPRFVKMPACAPTRIPKLTLRRARQRSTSHSLITDGRSLSTTVTAVKRDGSRCAGADHVGSPLQTIAITVLRLV